MATLTIKVDDDLKRAAEREFNQLGLTMSAGLTVYLNQVIKTHSIPFELKNTLDPYENIKVPDLSRKKHYKVTNKGGRAHLPADFPSHLSEI
ncbi:MAG: type II toxin-antitoxin system RelB/DinJ family antitoxin [Candidatus Ancillula sp.]|nr:type II toxin-antitoxin system RelB/DinJ family antitoxin [Candidatus Ancillula sp.]